MVCLNRVTYPVAFDCDKGFVEARDIGGGRQLRVPETPKVQMERILVSTQAASVCLARNTLAVDRGAERIEREGLLRNVHRLAGVGQTQGVQQPVEMLTQIVCAVVGDDLSADLQLKREFLASRRDVEAVDQLLRRRPLFPVEGHEDRIQSRQSPGVLQERVRASDGEHCCGILLRI